MTDQDTPQPAPKKRRSGSSTRKRNKVTQIRWEDGELAKATAQAEEAGLALGAYLRALVNGDPGPRHQRARPPINEELLRRILGQNGKTGSNVNQIAYRLHTGETPADIPELPLALRAVVDIRNAIFEALGKTDPPSTPAPVDKPDDHQGKGQK